MKTFIFTGAICGMIAVILGAIGAHGMKAILTADELESFRYGVTYQFYHALGLFAVAFCVSYFTKNKLFIIAGWLMLSGMILFSGSVYILSLTEITTLYGVSPFAGILLIASWFFIALGVIVNRKQINKN